MPLIVLTVLRSGKESRLRFDPTVVLAGLIRRQWHDGVPLQIIECPEIGLGRREARRIDLLLRQCRDPARFPRVLHVILRLRLLVADRHDSLRLTFN
jgi:hypothetical protein